MTLLAAPRILVCGPRDWPRHYYYAVADHLETRIAANTPVIIIEGGARGVDEAARWWCSNHKDAINISMPAPWGAYHRGAGPVRNDRMLRYLAPHKVIAWQYKDRDTPGTQHTIRRAHELGIPVEVVRHGRP